MLNFRAVLAIGGVGLLAACSSGPGEVTADIDKVADVKSSFGPEFKVKNIARTGLDPKLLAANTLPPGLKFEPADCSRFAVGQQLPQGVQGNMAAVAAEGNGNRFITIALETSEPVAFSEPGRSCRRIGFAGDRMRGLVETVEAPRIDGVQTLGVHRVVEALAGGKARVGELYNYSAYFGPYQVLVTANPLVAPDTPVVPVDTERARDLLVAAVAAVRG
ncbi:hypothetical protein MTER_31220 [Mycolicibacter terrae]|uniref:DUF5642 domain-containing protein n=1 Tax=Mycolicibacter terrae TaxID=1788 RepID=A0AAD1MID5_9MYCO|nr:DUF5642 family protein [Mycolicibacter terrae]ORW88625.1 hypothetical protein AWC28_05350 [Mycolicibacter terrae]BBX23711.1 hypothetical protein MTER_31220 [Mycolicibacter terrae]SNV60699.1 Conserved exported protein of uncharacterised function [Mycolicibacter terrae]